MTKKSLKKLITDLLAKRHMLSATDILEILKEQNTEYNKTSVYRVLEQLLEEGTLCRHHFDEDENLWELRTDHHLHLQCTNCSKVFKKDCDYIDPTFDDFQVDHHHVTLIGKCNDCKTGITASEPQSIRALRE